MKIKTKIIIALVIVLLIAGAFVGGIVFYSRATGTAAPVEAKTQIDVRVVEENISSIAEYASIDYYYTNAGQMSEQKEIYGFKLPFTTKNFVLSYDGEMKLGIDGSKITVSLDGTVITVTLPKAKILSHEIKEDTIKVLDQSKNIFNPITIEDYAGFATAQKLEMEKKIEEKGLIEKAQAETEAQLGAFLSAFPGIEGEYTIKFERGAES
ncbi:MAG: DUF4230 domain-containing protein [Oscillospiraceae bacterium]|nr:DUF4230 domain-containing protein [Oscillospiraceae bacterium]